MQNIEVQATGINPRGVLLGPTFGDTDMVVSKAAVSTLPRQFDTNAPGDDGSSHDEAEHAE